MSTKPVFINLFKINLPLSGFLSITHRISGLLIFFLILPFSAYFLLTALDSPEAFLKFFISKFNLSLISKRIKSGQKIERAHGDKIFINLDSPEAFLFFFENLNNNLLIRTFVLFMILIFQYHVFTGVRHMLLDFHIIGETLSSSNISAVITLVLFFINALVSIWLVLL